MKSLEVDNLGFEKPGLSVNQRSSLHKAQLFDNWPCHVLDFITDTCCFTAPRFALNEKTRSFSMEKLALKKRLFFICLNKNPAATLESVDNFRYPI